MMTIFEIHYYVTLLKQEAQLSQRGHATVLLT